MCLRQLGEGKFIDLIQGQKPYVQVDEPYRDVTIPNIEILNNEYQHSAVTIERADKSYLRDLV